MIPTKRQELDVTSTLDGRQIGMSIDENSLQHIMAVLTDLYSDPILAVVREYSTNARDAHIAAGKDDYPIEVYTPTALSPSLRIVDHGVGLSEEDIEYIYSKYGASTKTDSNDFNGVLGLGCKSALTYSSQFTVTAIKDGIKIIVSVSRDEEGVGTMTPLESSPTDEENGVMIQVPIKAQDRTDVKETAEEFFRYWKPGTVRLNDAEPAHVTGMQIGEHLLLEQVDSHMMYGYDYEHVLLMGGVSYPMRHNGDNEMKFDVPSGYRVIAEVPIGAVHFTPSREALNYTKRTKEVIKQLVQTFQTDLESAVTKEIEAQPTKHDALQAAIRWISVLPTALRNATFMYKGIELPTNVRPDKDGEMWIVSDGKEQKDWYGKRVRVGASSHVASITVSTVPDCIFVTGFARSFTPTVKHKLWEWCDQNNRDQPEHFVMTQADPTSPWIDPSQIISWPNDVEPIKLPRYQRQTKIATGPKVRNNTLRYDIWLDGEKKFDVLADDIHTYASEGRTVYYYPDGIKHASRWGNMLSSLYEQFVFVYFAGPRKDKFLRNFPDAVLAIPAVHEGCDWVMSQFTEIERQVIAYHQGYHYAYEHMSWAVRDKDIRRMLTLRDYDAKRRMWLVDTYNTIQRYCQDKSAVVLPELPDVLDTRYPLFNSNRYYNKSDTTIRRHLLLYMNMIYQLEQSA